jgi:hypothetical protein
LVVSDPLAGKRDALNTGETEVLTWPDLPKCPVSKGDSFKLRSCQVEIVSVKRTFARNNKEQAGGWRWEAQFNRYVPYTPRIPASQHGQEHPAQYVSSAQGAVDGVGEEVDRDYQRLLAEEGRLKTMMQGHRNRQVASKLAGEQRLLDARRKKHGSTVRYLERVQAHHERKAA